VAAAQAAECLCPCSSHLSGTPYELCKGQPVRFGAVEDGPDEVGGQQGQVEQAANISAVETGGVGEIVHAGVAALVEELLPAVGLGHGDCQLLLDEPGADGCCFIRHRNPPAASAVLSGVTGFRA